MSRTINSIECKDFENKCLVCCKKITNIVKYGMEQNRKKNYTAHKYLITEYKSIWNTLIKTREVLKHYGVSSSLKDKLSKNYYDTDDMFFHKTGVNINIASYASRNYSDLIVRYNNQKERTQFIADLPDTFIKKIEKKYNVTDQFQFISECVLDLLPAGISVEPITKTRELKVKLNVTKKRERFRVISSRGLKIILSFEQNLYINAKGEKVKLNMLEVRLDCGDEFIPDFEKFLRQLKLSETRMIKISESDIEIGLEYLDL